MSYLYPEFHFFRYENFPDPLTFLKDPSLINKVCSKILKSQSVWSDDLIEKARFLFTRVQGRRSFTTDDYRYFSELKLLVSLEEQSSEFICRKSFHNLQAFCKSHDLKSFCRSVLNSNGLSSKVFVANPVTLSYAFLFKRLFLDLSVTFPVIAPKSVKFHLFSDLIIEVKKSILLLYKALDIETDFDKDSDALELFNFFAGELCGFEVDLVEDLIAQLPEPSRGACYEIGDVRIR